MIGAGEPAATAAPRVSVVVVTYNHAPFIAQALDSILSQRTRFAVEVLISEDCSTDGTREIVQDYARRHPGRIRLLLSERNLNTRAVRSRAIEAARGTYVAWLDGDDYWSSADKLQRQADFLDAQPDCALCFHDALVVVEGGAEASRRYMPPTFPAVSRIDDIIARCFIPSCSPMFRASAVAGLPAWYDDCVFGDWPLYALAALHGSLAYIDEVWGVYRRHPGGVWTSRSERRQLDMLIRCLDHMHRHFDPRHRAAIARARAGYRRKLIWATDAEGDHLAAARELLRGLWHDRGDAAARTDRARLPRQIAMRLARAIRTILAGGSASAV